MIEIVKYQEEKILSILETNMIFVKYHSEGSHETKKEKHRITRSRGGEYQSNSNEQ